MSTMGTKQNSHLHYDPAVKQSRQAAMASGAPVYWTGKECKNGHVAHRYVGCGRCVKCDADQRRRRRSRLIVSEAIEAGVNGDARRAAEDLREQRRLERELSGYFE